MRKRVYLSILLLITFLLVTSSLVFSQNKKNIYSVIKKKAKFYKVNVYSEDQYSVLFYGKDKNFSNIEPGTDGIASGRTFFVYYKNITEKKNLYSILVLGKYQGNPKKEFDFFIEDMAGNVLFESKKYKYSEFSEKKFVYKEYKVEIKNIPEEFIIKFRSYSDQNDSLFIRQIDSPEHYSFEVRDETTYNEYKNKNFAIFPKLY